MKTGIIGEYCQLDGWHVYGTFPSPAEAREWVKRVDEAQGHHHARRWRRVKRSSRKWELAMEATECLTLPTLD